MGGRMITLKGVAFLQPGHADYRDGKRVVVTLVINPSGGNLATVDAEAGAQVTATVPVTSLTYRTEDGTAIAAATPATVAATFGVVQEAYVNTGERMIWADLADFSVGSVAHTGTARLETFETYGTVFVAPAPPPASDPIFTNPGTGLRARWYQNRNLAGEPVTDTVGYPAVHAFGVPADPSINDDAAYSVRWTGRIKMPAGQWRFKGEADDGFRVYLDGRLVLNYWSDQNLKDRYTGYFTYTADQLVVIWVEFYAAGESYDELRIQYQENGSPVTQIPITRLYPTDGSELPPDARPRAPQLVWSAEDTTRYVE